MMAAARKRLPALVLAVLACGMWHGCVEAETGLEDHAPAEVTAPAPAPADADEHAGHNHPPQAKPGDDASIAIQVVQGTPGGRPVTGGEVTVHLAGAEQHETLEVELDEHGVALLEGLSLAAQFRPRVSFVRDGISFDAFGETVGPDRTHQKVTVTVYEITDQEPEWTISMQHMMAYPVPGGVYIQQIMAVENPSDHAWLGPADADGVRRSFGVDLPEGYQDLEMAYDFHDCCSSIVEGRLASHKPMMPGPRRYRVHYILPAEDNQVSLELVTSAPVESMLLFVPHRYVGVRTEDLEQQEGAYNVHENPMTGYMANDIPAGERLVLTFTNLPPAQEHVHVEKEKSTSAPKMLAAIVGGIMLIVFVVVLVMKPAKKADADQAE